jgi:hypothetical protein
MAAFSLATTSFGGRAGRTGRTSPRRRGPEHRFVRGGQVRNHARALRREVGEDLDRAGARLRQRRGGLQDHQVDLAAEHRLHRRAGALEGNELDLGAGHLHHQDAGDASRPRSGRRSVPLPGLAFIQATRPFRSSAGKALARDDQLRVDGHQPDRREVKFLFVSYDGLIADIAWQVVKEGHEAKFWIRTRRAGDRRRLRAEGEGLAQGRRLGRRRRVRRRARHGRHGRGAAPGASSWSAARLHRPARGRPRLRPAGAEGRRRADHPAGELHLVRRRDRVRARRTRTATSSSRAARRRTTSGCCSSARRKTGAT